MNAILYDTNVTFWNQNTLKTRSKQKKNDHNALLEKT